MGEFVSVFAPWQWLFLVLASLLLLVTVALAVCLFWWGQAERGYRQDVQGFRNLADIQRDQVVDARRNGYLTGTPLPDHPREDGGEKEDGHADNPR